MNAIPLFYRGTTLDGPPDPAYDARYALIAPILAQYRRPITVLDLDCGTGYFGLRVAYEFGSVVVLADAHPGLPAMIAVNDAPTTIGLGRALTLADLVALVACEHFDVVLAMGGVSRFGTAAVPAIDALLRLGEQVIIEGPEVNAHEAIHDALEREAPLCLGHTPLGEGSAPLYHFVRPKPVLTKTRFKGPPTTRDVRVLSSRTHKVFFAPGKGEKRAWFPGINLATWVALNGMWPLRHEVEEAVAQEYHRALGSDTDVPYVAVGHGDVRLDNFILSGESVTLIDWNDPKGTPDGRGIMDTLHALHTRKVTRA